MGCEIHFFSLPPLLEPAPAARLRPDLTGDECLPAFVDVDVLDGDVLNRPDASAIL
jgi:hypothetical protein